jgi:hypothetical protein
MRWEEKVIIINIGLYTRYVVVVFFLTIYSWQIHVNVCMNLYRKEDDDNSNNLFNKGLYYYCCCHFTTIRGNLLIELTIKVKKEYVKYLSYDNSRLWNVKTMYTDTSLMSIRQTRLCSLSYWDKQYANIYIKYIETLIIEYKG